MHVGCAHLAAHGKFSYLGVRLGYGLWGEIPTLVWVRAVHSSCQTPLMFGVAYLLPLARLAPGSASAGLTDRPMEYPYMPLGSVRAA